MVFARLAALTCDGRARFLRFLAIVIPFVAVEEGDYSLAEARATASENIAK